MIPRDTTCGILMVVSLKIVLERVLKCWEDTPMQVSGRLPISWKVTESVGTMTWCTWKELRDPGYQLEDLGSDLLTITRNACEILGYAGTLLSFLLGVFAVGKRVFPWRC